MQLCVADLFSQCEKEKTIHKIKKLLTLYFLQKYVTYKCKKLLLNTTVRTILNIYSTLQEIAYI